MVMETNVRKIKVIGLMSGTSLDGLDMCLVDFMYDGRWNYTIDRTGSVDFPDWLRKQLADAQNMTAAEFALLHTRYGHFMGRSVAMFIKAIGIKPDLIASHGQTVFHQPEIGFTSQIGSGAAIAAETGIDCVCDFRTTDVALGGQGAPLVPIGDKVLFGKYSSCLNLGGFSNISYANEDGSRAAFDISPVNYVLNHYTRKIGLEFDRDGEIARSGQITNDLLHALDGLGFYKETGPKSLGREWVEAEVFPLIDSYELDTADILATFCEHVAHQICAKAPEGEVLTTGGGALNTYLIERMQSCAGDRTVFVVPDRQTINFKEALVFALLGAMYVWDMPGCLSSVTGARIDNIGGCLYKAPKCR